MIGRRVEFTGQLLAPGDYVVGEPWYACTPSGMLANVSMHEKTVHEDGTLTVSPSILVRGHDGEWHGFLERGVWRQC